MSETKTHPPITLEALALRCDKERSNWMAAPVRVTRDGEVWTLGTEGHLLLAVPVDLGAEPYPKDGGQDIIKWLTDPRPSAFTAEMPQADLLTMTQCRPATKNDETVCDECNGHKWTSCTCKCGDVHDSICCECDGTGFADGTIEIMGQTLICSLEDDGQGNYPLQLLGGPKVDAGKIYKVLFGLPGERVKVEWGPNPSDQIRISGDGWKAILMPLREGSK